MARFAGGGGDGGQPSGYRRWVYPFFHGFEAARATAALHFNGASGLWLLAYQADGFGDLLRWEAARGGVLFPHVYGVLPMDGLVWSAPLELGKDGVHVFPVGFWG